MLLSSDYSHCIARVLAYFSKDEHLIKVPRGGRYPHTSTAMRVFGIERPDNVTKYDRQNAGSFNFGGLWDFRLWLV